MKFVMYKCIDWETGNPDRKLPSTVYLEKTSGNENTEGNVRKLEDYFRCKIRKCCIGSYETDHMYMGHTILKTAAGGNLIPWR